MQLIPDSSHYRNPDQQEDLYRLEKKVDQLLSSLEPVPYQDSGAEPPPPGLLSYWRTLKRRKLIVLLAGFAVAVAAWFYSERQPKIYQARVTLEILEPDRGSMNMKNFSPGGNSMFTQETYLQTQVNILHSKSLLKRVGQRLVSDGVIHAEDLPQDVGPSGQERANTTDPVVSLAQIGITPLRDTRLVEITYDAKDPGLAATIANTLATEFIQQDVDTRVGYAEQTRTWLQKQLEDTKDKLEASEAKLQAYAKASGLLYTSPKGNIAEQTEDKLQFLANDLSEAQAKRANLEARYETFVRSPDSKVDGADSPALHDIQSRLLDLRRQRAALGSQYTSEYSKVKELDAQIGALQEGEAKEYQRWLVQLYDAYKTEVAHEKLLQTAYTASKAIHYNVLKREVETNRNLYDALLAGMKEAGVNASARVRNARVVDPAEPPRRPYSPRPFRFAAAGFIGGLMCGVAFVLISENSDRRLKSPGMAPSWLNVPELGVIPSTKSHLLPTSRRDWTDTHSQNGSSRGVSGMVARFTRHEPALIGSPVFEAFHSVVTSILSPGRSSHIPKVLVVTSGSLHEGKSTIIGNLGLMAAQIGQRVVLLDGDLRNPRLHKVYGVSNERGLSNLLVEPAELSGEVLSEFVLQTDVPNLFILPSGPFADPASILHSERLAETVALLRAAFDLVLIDTPPVLPFPDARIFGKLSDAVVLVVRAGRTTRDLALAAKARFVGDGLQVFGTILNDWNGKDSPYEYTDDYSYRR
jgi:succinoglycan biosynthesis transport protein ExoP